MSLLPEMQEAAILNRLRFVTNALGTITEYRYNELDQQMRQIDANKHSNPSAHI